MVRVFRCVVVCCFLGFPGLPAWADADRMVPSPMPAAVTGTARPLGVTGAEFGLGAGAIFPEDGAARYLGHASLDVAITAHHGLQGDLSLEGLDGTQVGRVAGHLYMLPRPGQKYGLFGMVADLDDRAFTYVTAGAEGIFDLGHGVGVEARGGLGLATQGPLDVVFAGALATWQAAPALRLDVGLDAAHVDEVGLTATLTETRIGARLARPRGGPALDLAVVHEALGDLGSETSLRTALTWRFGDTGPTTARPFRGQDPVAPLIRRGLY